MSAAAFATLMILIVFGFIAAMIWAYRKNDYREEKQEVQPEQLNCLNETLMTITAKPQAEIREEKKEAPQKAEEQPAQQINGQTDPMAKIEMLESRKHMIQNKNHIKKSAADEYFEKTKGVANEILQPKTK